MADRFAASIDGIDLEIETTSDDFEKAIARHEIPGVDGALLEDMGQKAHVLGIRCYFWDHADHLTYGAHLALLNHLEKTDNVELVHPKYGPMQGKIERINVRHDDRDMTAEVDLTFVEEGRGDLTELPYNDVEGACEEAFLAGQDEQQGDLAAGVTATLGAEAPGLLAKTLSAVQSILDQVQGLSAAARAYVMEVDNFVTGLEATLAEVSQPANSLISTINYAENLPGRVIGSVTRCVERYVALYEIAQSAPARFIDNMENAFNHLAVVLGLEETKKNPARASLAKALRAGFAHQTALQLATIYKADEGNRQSLKKSETTASFDASGRFVNAPAVAAVLTVQELEQTLYTVRAMLAPADPSLLPASPASKELALQLLQHVNTVKLEREKLYPMELDNPMPLHLVCLKAGLPYNAAARILAVNPGIVKPCFVSGTVDVYGR